TDVADDELERLPLDAGGQDRFGDERRQMTPHHGPGILQDPVETKAQAGRSDIALTKRLVDDDEARLAGEPPPEIPVLTRSERFVVPANVEQQLAPDHG